LVPRVVTLFILALYKFLGHLRERSSMEGLRAIRESGTLASLVSLLFRDGVMFYAMYVPLVPPIFKKAFTCYAQDIW